MVARYIEGHFERRWTVFAIMREGIASEKWVLDPAVDNGLPYAGRDLSLFHDIWKDGKYQNLKL